MNELLANQVQIEGSFWGHADKLTPKPRSTINGSNSKKAALTRIPYFLWSNRGLSQMTVYTQI